MKQLIRIAAFSLAAMVAGLTAPVATAQSNFKVDLTLAAKCFINLTSGADADTSDVTLSYDAFQTAHEESSTGFAVSCTNTLPYSIAISNDASSIAGVNYYLKVVAGTTASYVSAAGGGALGPVNGNGSAQPYTIGVRAPSGQAGTCGTASCNGQNTHTITVAY